ncbi:MAG TPA: sodium:solute symporter family protein [Verrucomicrobiae bacterium]|jgi:SSS family solute:Na+ symporter|nr:sodium:solute symporter family protein [Verrucomicrobiae bacterium]
MIPVVVVLIYLAVIAVIGSVAFRRGRENTEDFFLASRSIGSMFFFLSIFATNMTAFAILGSSGQAFRQGIGIFGLMASSSALVIPLTIFFIGTRLWSIGKKFGHQTQVSFFRDRWECSHIGTLIFILTICMLLPYMIVSLMGGGTVLRDISGGMISYPLGCAIVGLVVTLNVFLGGMRGTVWVNVLQTIMFLCFGAVALMVISSALPGGFSDYINKIAANDKTRFLLTREKMSPEYFWSYTLIPLSSIMFPHMAIMCFSARKVTAFKRTVILYPLAIMAIWLPCVFLGVLGHAALPDLKPAEADGVLLHMLTTYAPAWLAGLLGAGIISAVMGSDTHQVLGASTMFTKDIFVHYGGKERFGEKGSVILARVFILVITAIAYWIALISTSSIFELAVRFAFSGFAAMAPVMVAALFWRRSTKWGALASTLWVAATLFGSWYLQRLTEATAPKPGQPAMVIFESWGHLLERNSANVLVHGYLPVVPMVLGSALIMIVFSVLTPPPSRATVDKYFGAAPAGI